MSRSFSSCWVWTFSLVALWAVCQATPRQKNLQYTCPTEPFSCLQNARKGGNKLDECRTDDDCQLGARCCYRGCRKRCGLPNPCEQVICQEGFTCRTRETPCVQPPCQVEASCVSTAEAWCPNRTCSQVECPPGFQMATDNNGCPLCQCVRKLECGSTCFTFCAYGFQEDNNGCPLCICKPQPANPCSSMTCPSTEECRLVKTTCTRSPCEPTAMCVRKSTVLYDNSCGLNNPSLVGLPILDSNKLAELDCYDELCPDHTVCTTFGPSINRCCWQSTQDKVLPPPKGGECPQEFMINFRRLNQKCEVDGQCPGEQKCCYRNRKAFARAVGFCMDPVHGTLQNSTAECQRSPILNIVFSSLGLC